MTNFFSKTNQLNRRKFILSSILALLSFSFKRNDKNKKFKTNKLFNFEEVSSKIKDKVRLPSNYEFKTLLSWGDSITSKDDQNEKLNSKNQYNRFGYNCDFIAYMPIPRNSQNSNHGLLCVNHEYIGYKNIYPKDKILQKEDNDLLMAAVGHSVTEIKKINDEWVIQKGSYNKRFDLLNTKFLLSGPVAGDKRVITDEDPTGKYVIGTAANCSGGITPWGTVLFCEENFNKLFKSENIIQSEKRNYQRYGITEKESNFNSKFHKRFNTKYNKNEPNRFGWIVEYDPYNPNEIPKKRTALGRVMRETATVHLSHDKRVVVYSGDDAYFEYIYKFVSKEKYLENGKNSDLLDQGVLYVAKFLDNKTLKWIPLIFGQNNLTKKNGFNSQADVLIEARIAAEIVGATPMDRPEGITISPKDESIFIMLTKNKKRTKDNINIANTTVNNVHGHIIRMFPPIKSNSYDHTSQIFKWEKFLEGGEKNGICNYNQSVSKDGTISCPDNAIFDKKNRLWICSDGNEKSQNKAEGLWVCNIEGKDKKLTKRFLSAPIGAEITGPCFTPDEKSLFLSIQHPGETRDISKNTSRWPHFNQNDLPKPSVIVVQNKKKNKKILD